MSRRDAYVERRLRKIDEMHTCGCGGYRANCGGAPTCTSCGLQGPFTIPVPELDLMSWSKKKSVHKRSKWFAKRIAGVVKSSDERMLTADFMEVVSVLMRCKLIRKNISRYSYYIIRLASRRGLVPLMNVRDMCEGYSKNMFDDRLFGSVYKELGWDTECVCPIFLRWKTNTLKEIKIGSGTW